MEGHQETGTRAPRNSSLQPQLSVQVCVSTDVCLSEDLCVHSCAMCTNTCACRIGENSLEMGRLSCPSEPQEVEGPPGPTGSDTPLPDRLCDLGSRCPPWASAPACEMGVRLPPGSGQLRGVRGKGAGASLEDRHGHGRPWPGGQRRLQRPTFFTAVGETETQTNPASQTRYGWSC